MNAGPLLRRRELQHRHPVVVVHARLDVQAVEEILQLGHVLEILRGPCHTIPVGVVAEDRQAHAEMLHRGVRVPARALEAVEQGAAYEDHHEGGRLLVLGVGVVEVFPQAAEGFIVLQHDLLARAQGRRGEPCSSGDAALVACSRCTELRGDDGLADNLLIVAPLQHDLVPEVRAQEPGQVLGGLDAEIVEHPPILLAARHPEREGVGCDSQLERRLGFLGLRCGRSHIRHTGSPTWCLHRGLKTRLGCYAVAVGGPKGRRKLEGGANTHISGRTAEPRRIWYAVSSRPWLAKLDPESKWRHSIRRMRAHVLAGDAP